MTNFEQNHISALGIDPMSEIIIPEESEAIVKNDKKLAEGFIEAFSSPSPMDTSSRSKMFEQEMGLFKYLVGIQNEKAGYINKRYIQSCLMMLSYKWPENIKEFEEIAGDIVADLV